MQNEINEQRTAPSLNALQSVLSVYIPFEFIAIVEKMTTTMVLKYLPAFRKYEYGLLLEFQYRFRHWAKRNQGGRQRRMGTMKSGSKSRALTWSA